MNVQTFTIEGMPEEPGIYESENFPLDYDLGDGERYSAYYKYPDGTFWEGERDGDEPLILPPNEAPMYGPYRKVGDL